MRVELARLAGLAQFAEITVKPEPAQAGQHLQAVVV